VRAAAALLLAPVVVLAAGCATALPVVPQAAPPAAATAPPAPAATGTARVHVTFYGGPDNDPPGSDDIAYPNGRHATAGGTGTATDPITLATDPRELPPGTLVYEAQLKKYFVMEDDCEECIADWGNSHRPHIDLWTASAGPGLPACEEALTPPGLVTIEINPPSDRPVDPRPLYDVATDRCLPAS